MNCLSLVTYPPGLIIHREDIFTNRLFLSRSTIYGILRRDTIFIDWVRSLLKLVIDGQEFLVVISELHGEIVYNVKGLDLNDDIIPDVWLGYLPWVVGQNLGPGYVKRSLRIRDESLSEKSRSLGIKLSENDVKALRSGKVVKQINGSNKNHIEYNMVMNTTELKKLVHSF